ncbi:hypothetical protein ACJX0J_024067, partial [Zea mays]
NFSSTSLFSFSSKIKIEGKNCLFAHLFWYILQVARLSLIHNGFYRFYGLQS